MYSSQPSQMRGLLDVMSLSQRPLVGCALLNLPDVEAVEKFASRGWMIHNYQVFHSSLLFSSQKFVHRAFQ